jgi:hypothetical protein
MKKYVLLTALGLLFMAPIFMSFSGKKTASLSTQWRVVTMVESVVPGKLGRSKIMYVDNTGASSEQEAVNLFSLTGINFSNLQANNKSITELLGKCSDEGWSLENVSTGAFGEGGSHGIFVTRYLFKK